VVIDAGGIAQNLASPLDAPEPLTYLLKRWIVRHDGRGGDDVRRMLMSGLLRRAVLVASALVVCTGGVVLGTTLGSNAGVAQAKPPPVGHFLCYTATAKGFQPPAVELINQFAPNGFTAAVGAARLHCNPAKKIVGTAKYPVINANAHLLCFAITAPTQPTFTVAVTNQFGTAELTTGQPGNLCLPSWKSLTGPPNKTPNQPPGLSHFTCYPVAYVPGTPPFKVPPVVQVKDQFAKYPVKVKVGAPQSLCVPTEKMLPTGATYPILNSTTHLLCFAVSATPRKSPVFDENQFGTGAVTIVATKTLCLPSTKKIIPTG
jgi:hypothetical protein